jgi:hypothetical protein
MHACIHVYRCICISSARSRTYMSTAYQLCDTYTKYTSACIYTCIPVCVYKHIHTYIHTYIHIYIYAYIHTCLLHITYTWIYKCMHVYIPLYIYASACMYICIPLYMYIICFLSHIQYRGRGGSSQNSTNFNLPSKYLSKYILFACELKLSALELACRNHA